MWDIYNNFHFHCDTSRYQKLLARAEFIKTITEIPGDIIDAGVFKGISTIQFAHLLEIYQPHSRTKVIAFDTFENAFPHMRGDETKAATDHEKIFKGDTFENLETSLKRLNLIHRVQLIRGDVVQTIPKYFIDNPGVRVSLIHCDLDVYQPTLSVLQTAWPKLSIGGLAVFDEYAEAQWGESDAVDEFFKTLEKRPMLKQLSFATTPTAYCQKLS